MVFVSPSTQIPTKYLKIEQDRFRPYNFQLFMITLQYEAIVWVTHVVFE
jgi:hypothetical protein